MPQHRVAILTARSQLTIFSKDNYVLFMQQDDASLLGNAVNDIQL